MSFGQKLREARENKGYSLDYIEEETKIRKLYLNALEKENFQVLPPKVYATGFVRRYSKFLDLDQDAMVEEFQGLAYADEAIADEPEITKKEVRIDFNIPYRNILAGIVFLIVAIWAGNLILDSISKQANIPPPAPDTNQSQLQEPVAPNGQQAPTAVSGKATFLVEAHQTCWITVAVDGETVLTKTLQAGEKHDFEAEELFYVKAGNAGGIDITYNGEKVEPLGDSGEVKEKEFRIES